MKTHESSNRIRIILHLGMAFMFCVGVASAQDGLTWSAMESGSGSTLRGISVIDSGFAVSSGTGSTVLKYDGTSWAPFGGQIKTDPPTDFPGVAGDNTGWGTDEQFYGVSAIAEDDIWVVSYNSSQSGPAYWDGELWGTPRDHPGAPMSSYDRNMGVWAGGSDRVIIVGSNARIHRYDGENWGRPHSSSGSGNYFGVHGILGGEIWSVGSVIVSEEDDRRVMVSNDDGDSWAARTAGLAAGTLYGVYTLDASHTWLAGAQGVVFWDGSTYTTQLEVEDVTFQGVYAKDSENVWAVGGSGSIYYYDGIDWTQINHGLYSGGLYDIGADEKGHLYVVGAGGTILHAIPEPGVLALLAPFGVLLYLKHKRVR